MMEILGRGDAAMNLIGLILIAALSGGIVAVSLRLRASASLARMRPDGDRSPEREVHQPVHGGRENWLQYPFGLKGETGLYHSVEDRIRGGSRR